MIQYIIKFARRQIQCNIGLLSFMKQCPGRIVTKLYTQPPPHLISHLNWILLTPHFSRSLD